MAVLSKGSRTRPSGSWLVAIATSGSSFVCPLRAMVHSAAATFDQLRATRRAIASRMPTAPMGPVHVAWRPQVCLRCSAWTLAASSCRCERAVHHELASPLRTAVRSAAATCD